MEKSVKVLNAELKVEREQITKLKSKIEVQREHLRTARSALQDAASDPKSRKLIIEMDQMKNEHVNYVASVKRDREALQTKILQYELVYSFIISTYLLIYYAAYALNHSRLLILFIQFTD